MVESRHRHTSGDGGPERSAHETSQEADEEAATGVAAENKAAEAPTLTSGPQNNRQQGFDRRCDCFHLFSHHVAGEGQRHPGDLGLRLQQGSTRKWAGLPLS